MKKMAAIVLAVLVCAGVAMSQEEEQGGGTKNFKSMYSNMGRGVANMFTFWLEVPRNLWLDSTRNPYFGWFSGTMDGAFLTTARAFGGVTDFVTFGLTGPSIYSDVFPEYIWDAKWSEMSDTQKAWGSFDVPKDALIKQQQAQEAGAEAH